MLAGYKTYIVAVVGVIGAIGTYLSGDASVIQMAQAILTAVLGMTIRAGIAGK